MKKIVLTSDQYSSLRYEPLVIGDVEIKLGLSYWYDDVGWWEYMPHSHFKRMRPRSLLSTDWYFKDYYSPHLSYDY